MVRVALVHQASVRGRQFVRHLRDVGRGDRPDLIDVDTVVVVSQQVAKVHDVAPRHLRVTRLEVIGDCVGSFADDLDQSFSGTLVGPVVVKRYAPAFDEFSDLSGSFEDVGDAKLVGPARIGTASRRM